MDIPSTEIFNVFKESTEQPDKWLLTNTRGKSLFQFGLQEEGEKYLSFIGKEIIEFSTLSNQPDKIDTIVLGNATEFMSDVNRLVDDVLPFLNNDGVMLFWINHDQNSVQVKSIVSLMLYMHKKNFRIEQVIRPLWTGFIAIPTTNSNEIDFAESLLKVLDRLKKSDDTEQNQSRDVTASLLKKLVEAKQEKLNLITNEKKY